MLDNSIKEHLFAPRWSPLPAQVRARFTTYILCMIASIGLSGINAAETASIPRVIMLEISGVTPNDDTLYRAIRAQLAAASLQLDFLTISDPQFVITDPLSNATRLAAEYGAAVVFWIKQEGPVFTVFFYNSDASDPRIHTRELDLVAESPLSRFDAVGNAVSSIIEESISLRGHARAHAAPTPSPSPPSPPVPRSQGRPRKWMDIFAVYSGSLFAGRRVLHGAGGGLGFLPTEHIALTVAYSQYLASTLVTEQCKLSLTSRNIETSIAGRLAASFLDLRLGLAWSVDVRSYSMKSNAEAISPRPGGVNGIHSVTPFATAVWILSNRFGIVTGLGANIAVNPKTYKLLRSDDSEVLLLVPFRAKLTWRLGLIVQL
jgi:hypothetical protein